MFRQSLLSDFNQANCFVISQTYSIFAERKQSINQIPASIFMKYALRLLYTASLFCSIIILFSGSLHAQSIVVSEYHNVTAVPEGEWTELFVIQDNLTIVGYTLRDNGTNTDKWQGGIRFKDIPLWRNLRAGTAIVVNHRIFGNTIDKSAVDGYIEVDANDISVFDTLATPDGGAWEGSTLNISQTADILQIRDASGNHVHALAHGTNIGDYAALPQPKLLHPGTITGNVRVYPGATLADYSGTGTKTFESTINQSRGRPNLGTAQTDIPNSLFWRATRQPSWTTPTLTASFIGTDVHLSWNSMTDPNSADNIQGYLVLVVSELQPDTNVVPQDGKSYAVGSTIGDWRVLANIAPSQTTVFDDIVTTIPCGVSYKYRVFAFRFSQDETDNTAMSLNPTYGRGRSYNETSFGTAKITKIAPAKPDISASGPLTFCLGKSVTLSTVMAGVTFQWSKNGGDIPGATQSSIVVNTAGQYRVRVLSPTGCSTESDVKEVIIATAPTAQITASSLTLCAGDTVSLVAGAADSYSWIKDGLPLPAETKQTLKANSVGSYKVIVKNAAGCADTSQATTITARSVSYSFNVSELDFGKLNDCQSSVQKTVSVQNDTKEDIRIENIVTTAGYSLVSPTLPITIRDAKTVVFTFQFAPQTSGTTTGSADFVATPCNVSRRLLFTGSKDVTKVVLSTSSVDFGTILSCDNTGRDTTIEITNNGTSDLVISGRSVIPAAGYSLSNNITFPKTVKPNEKVQITIHFQPGGDGSYFSELAISYSMGVCTDTLRLKLQGIITSPTFSTSVKNIDFAPLQACESLRDTTIILQNPGSNPLTITKQPSDPNVQFLNLPLVILPNQTAQLRVRFQPLTQGTFAIIVPIVADKCNATTTITINGSKLGTTFLLSSQDVNFGDMTYCSPAQLQQDILLNIGGSTAGAKVSSVIVPQPFSINLTNGQNISDGQKLTLTFAPTATGNFVDSIGITFEPCGIIKYIKVRGRRISTGFSITQVLTDFGIVDTGTTSTQVVVFKNTGTAPLHVTSVTGVTAPFSVVGMTNTPPVTLATDQTIEVTLLYTPTIAGRDSIAVKFNIDKPCDTSQMTSLVGTGKVSPPPPPPDTIKTSATLQIANGTAGVGERVTFPITITSTDINLSKIYRMTVDVRYNPRLLMPRAVRAGNQQTGFTATFADVVPGQTRITLENPDGLTSTQFVNAGTFAEFECEALLGDELTTPLTLSNETFARLALSTTALTEGSGVFTLSGDCALDSRKVVVGGTVTLTQKPISSNTIEFEFETVSEERTTLMLYSSLGLHVATLTDAELKHGKHSADLSLHTIANGMYYAVLRTGMSVRVLPVVIER